MTDEPAERPRASGIPEPTAPESAAHAPGPNVGDAPEPIAGNAPEPIADQAPAAGQEPTDPGPAVPWAQPEAPVAGPDPIVPGADPALAAGTLWQPTGKPRSRRMRIVVAAIVVVGVLLVIGSIGSAINRASTGYASTLYGGSFEKLSSEDRKALSDRFDRMLAGKLDGLSQQQIEDRVVELVRGGLPRLDDASLVRRLRLQTTAIDAATEADCSAFSRASLAGQPVSSDIGLRVIANLDGKQLADWMDVQADAIEAELASAPPQRRVTQGDVETTLQSIFGGMDQAMIDRIVAVNDHPATSTDADVCAAVRAIYDSGVTLTTPDIELLARYDVS